MKIIELETVNDPTHFGPGVYTVKDDPHIWAVEPMNVNGKECIPYQWARDFPELEGFVARFPLHWHVDELIECWIGNEYKLNAVYWARR